MGTIMIGGALLTVLLFVVLVAFILCAATWDALVEVCTQLKEYFK
jgi:hypothetical protein